MKNKTKITIRQHSLTILDKPIFEEFSMIMKAPETDEEKENDVDEIVKAFNEQNIGNNIKAIKVNGK
jgi:hypothetical protein